MYQVEFDNVVKQLRKLPEYVVIKLMNWAREVERFGLPTVRKTPGYHDEPLRGKREGQRSIRLSKGYRAIYSKEKSNHIVLVIVEEVKKHDYR